MIESLIAAVNILVEHLL